MLTRVPLFRRLNFDRDEAATAFMLSLSLFLAIGGLAVIGRTVSRTMFLSGLPTQFIPFRYLAVMSGVVLGSILYARLAGRFRREQLIVGSTAALIAGVLVFRLLLYTPLANRLWLLGGLYVFLETATDLTIVQFWSFAADIVHTRQAKRLFPIVTASGNLGSIAAGATVTLLASRLGAPNLLYLLAVLLLVYLLLVWRLSRRHAAAPAPATNPARTSGGPLAGLAAIRASALLSTMLVVTVLITLAVNTVDYQFDLTLKRSFASDPQGLSTYLGGFYFWAGLTGLVVQALLTGPLLRRVGIGAALLVLPLGLLSGSVLVLASGAALWAVTLARSTDTIFRYTLHDTSFNLLYVPIDRQIRSQARAIIDGIFKPVSIGLAGLVFFSANLLAANALDGSRTAVIGVLPWSLAAMLAVSLGILALLRLRPVYLKTLHASIHRRYFDPAQEPLDLNDANTVEIIKTALRHSDPAQLLHALGLASEIPQVDWSAALLPLLAHPSPLVRGQALRLLGRSGDPHATAPVRGCFDDPDPEVRAAAVLAWWALSSSRPAPAEDNPDTPGLPPGAQSLDEQQPWLSDPQAVVQAAGLAGALRYGSETTRLAGIPLFEAMLASPDSACRAAAAAALAELPPELRRRWLPAVLNDSAAPVQLQAIRSAGKCDDPRMIPILLPLLDSPHLTAAVIDTLVSHGEAVFPYLQAWYSGSTDQGRPEEQDRSGAAGAQQAAAALAQPPTLAVRRAIPGLAARIPTLQAARFLMGCLDEPDDLARARLYRALGRLRQAGVPFSAEAPLPEADLAVIRQHYNNETRLAYTWAVQTTVPCQPDDGAGLLHEAVAIRLRYALDRLFYLLTIIYPNANLALVRANLFRGAAGSGAGYSGTAASGAASPQLRANAIELLDTLLPRSYKATLLPLLEGSPKTILAVAQREFHLAPPDRPAWLAQSIESADPWLAVCALSSLAHRPLPELAPWVERSLAAGAALVRETARLAACGRPVDNATHQAPEAAAGAAGGPYPDPGGTPMTVTTIERILLLRGVELFKEVPAQDLELIARLCSVANFAPGQRLITQGEAADGLFLLVEGEVEVTIAGMGVVSRRSAGDVIGEIGVFVHNVRTATCTAVTDVTALYINQADFWDLLEHDASLSVGVIRVLVPKLIFYRHAERDDAL